MTTLDDLDFETVIGQGSHGTVWRARWRGPVPRTVAVKRVRVGADPALRDRVRHEATILSTLDHPNVVRVLDVIEDRGEVALVMPHAEGGSLADRLRDRGALPLTPAVGIITGLAAALAAVHRSGIVHRDVTPDNVLLTRDDEPLLCDFGLATAEPDETGAAAGTPGYVDPVVAAGARPDPRSDVYGLAATAYHVLSGRLPVTGDDRASRIEAVAAGHTIPLAVAAPGVPPGLATLIDRSLSPDPEARPLDAAAFLALLVRSTAAGGTTAHPPRPTPPAGVAPPARGTVEFTVRPLGEPTRQREDPPRSGTWSLVLATLLLSVLAVEVLVIPADRLTAVVLLQAAPAVATAVSVLVSDRQAATAPTPRRRRRASLSKGLPSHATPKRSAI